ncbi:GntR family transcriptional regulator [Rhodococcus fascians]|nr:GntR family transcriptional regulator [Rhodococcus fascians]MBY3998453.1 GntR family transcriptional regulator [Rhodococcus fascians]MBY4004552.1 GntR family transcriptional regulator [Rhodococcus fascians]MBY4009266.1 GntR family transcriptional regulator [Rhodococcus fascians]MBY4019759.1 GntR family transcriptional regulator [Rhodococcus fascians]
MPDTLSGGAVVPTLYTQISDDIVHGRLGVHDRLSENALSQRYGVSRTPIREALTRLEQDGMIVRQGAMARIRVRSHEEVNDIYRARTWLEQAIAEDAANRRGETDILRLRAAWEREDRLDPLTSSPDELMVANRGFHAALAAASHNATLEDLQAKLTLQVVQLPATTLGVPGRWEAAHEQHRKLIDSVENRDAASAGAIARSHLDQARKLRLKLQQDLL